ncbi:uracil-DNA glycosylase [Simkania negevensis]|uniref:Uracil-DNA glycosylase n=1 Tax=Simkania negevensis (strain ATCC VR-1471 / DSM 27360 / Z) TaxID=331113 RepID=F8L559_SIMNZ|nr:uracil-DNA glycosylase [Simkania negevensis]CCB87940.1 uracil-DNA glycosylase [Simkania negevensis Z]
MVMTLEKGWHQALDEELKKPYIQALKTFLSEEKKRGITVYPPEPYVFNAFRQTPFDQVKVVIMGQDPYHGAHQAHGLCFSVQHGINPPPSLKNIYREMQDDLGIPPAHHGNLEKWAKQGVLMLNATLTVQAGNPKSHYGRGWETFTDAVIWRLCQRQDPLVFILWGKSAKEKCENILSQTNHPHVVLKAAHPSPYSATEFFGCRHFSKTNEYLKKWGKTPIDWALN